MKLLKTIEACYFNKTELSFGSYKVFKERIKRQTINVINVKTVLDFIYRDDDDSENTGTLIVMNSGEGFVVYDNVDRVIEYLNE